MENKKNVKTSFTDDFRTYQPLLDVLRAVNPKYITNSPFSGDFSWGVATELGSRRGTIFFAGGDPLSSLIWLIGAMPFCCGDARFSTNEVKQENNENDCVYVENSLVNGKFAATNGFWFPSLKLLSDGFLLQGF